MGSLLALLPLPAFLEAGLKGRVLCHSLAPTANGTLLRSAAVPAASPAAAAAVLAGR